MDNLLEKSSYGRSLFTAVNAKRSSNDVEKPIIQERLSQDNDVTFLIDANPALYLQLGTSNEHAIENLSHRIARDPLDLRLHVQRMTLYLRMQNSEGVYGALIDLFIAIGENGLSIRQRMLTQAKPFLSNQRLLFFNSIMQRGLRNSDPVPHAQTAVLCKGYIGKKQFIVQTAHASCRTGIDPRQEAIDCLIYGQVDEARKILEQAVLQEPWREDLQNDLLEIYWATRDLKACQAMYERLADEFIPEHHAWIEVVERISDALGGV